MNKSKFLKRSLATLLAILMAVAMIPVSAFAADDDVVDFGITVDTYSATRGDDGNYTVTVWDSNDVTINWAPIPGTTLKLVTGGKNPDVELDMPHKLYLAENADIVGEDTYEVKLRETTNGDKEYTLTIKVESTIPDDDATLSAVRVDNTKGTYAFGYLGETAIPGYISDVEAGGIEAHAIKGDIDNDHETVTITLPFGMKPADVGMAQTLDSAVFAPTSVHAYSVYEWVDEEHSTITVTAKTGVKNVYKVIFKHEEIFESFDGETNLADLPVVKVPTAETKLPTLHVIGKTKFVPTFKTNANVMRIMGNGSTDAESHTQNDDDVKLAFVTTDPEGEGMNLVGATNSVAGQEDMLKLVTSGHANWTVAYDVTDIVYLLVRTKANPIGAWLKIDVDAENGGKSKAKMTEIQFDNTESVTNIGDSTTVNVTVDNTHSFTVGNTGANDPEDPASHCYIHVTTNNPAKVTIPNQEEFGVNGATNGWTSSSSSSDPNKAYNTRHLLTGVNAKSGQVTVRVLSEDGTYIDYTVKLTASKVQTLGLKKVELRDAKGGLVAASTVGAKVGTPFELEIPYSYFAGKPVSASINGSDVAGLEMWVYPDAGAAVVPGNHGVMGTAGNKIAQTAGLGSDDGSLGVNVTAETPFENSITSLSQIWVDKYTLDADGNAKTTDNGMASLDSILTLTVSNGRNTSKEVYQVKIKRAKPLENAAITGIAASKALDKDYIYSVATTLGTQVNSQTDMGQAYAGAVNDVPTYVDSKGNNLPAFVDEVNKTIKIEVPYDWDETKEYLYLTGVNASACGYGRVLENGAVWTGKAFGAMDLTEQEDQTEFSTSLVNRGFTKLTTSPVTARPENILYVVSEKDMYPDVDAPAITLAAGTIEKQATKAYKMYIVKVGSENTGRALTGVTSSKVNVQFDATYDSIKITVPGSYNWAAFRKDNSHDFQLDFTASEGALIIDKGQYEADEDIAEASVDANSKYDNTRNGTATLKASDSKDEYQRQLNLHNQLNDNTWFFVMDGELYIYDELSGKETRVTGVGENFTNSNWGEIKTKQAEIRVYNEAQGSHRNYRLDLVVGEQSDSKDILSLKVGDTTATISGTTITASLPEGSDVEQALSIQASANASVTVNGEPYQDSRKIDVSKAVTIVVTAENGTDKTYTLTTTFDGSNEPSENPSDKYTDLTACSNSLRESVKRALDMGLMVGTGSTTFSPKANVRRQDVALIIARADVMAKSEDIRTAAAADDALKNMYGGQDAFDDVSGLSDLYKSAIAYCNENGFISGNGNGGFDPAKSLTREQAAVILTNWSGNAKGTTSNTNSVTDWSSVHDWAKPYVNTAISNGLMSGTGNGKFDPALNLTREMTAAVLVRVFEK